MGGSIKNRKIEIIDQKNLKNLEVAVLKEVEENIARLAEVRNLII